MLILNFMLIPNHKLQKFRVAAIKGTVGNIIIYYIMFFLSSCLLCSLQYRTGFARISHPAR